MVEQILDSITKLFIALNTPFGVASLAIIAVGIVPKIPALSNALGRYLPCNVSGVSELKPVLTELRQSITKISGNDLVHVQASIDNLGRDTARRMDDFDNKLAAHDKQAAIILEKQKETCKTVDLIFDKINQK